MSEEEQEKLYELLFKDTKNKLEETIKKQQKQIEELKEKSKKCEYYEMVASELYRSRISKENEIEELKDKNASLQKEIKLMKSININDNYISKDKIRKFIKEKAKTDTYNFTTIVVKDIEELLEE